MPRTELHPESGPGQNEDRIIRVFVGLPEQQRARLSAGQEHYALALHALERQDDWSAQEHAAFWTVALRQWPAVGGRRRTSEDLAVAAATLAREGLTVKQIALALGVKADTIHARDGTRPSIDLGEDTLRLREAAQESQGARLLRAHGHLWEPERALPRVYLDGTDAPEDGFLNPLVELLPGALVVAPAGTRYLELADAKRRELWSAQRIRDPALEWAERGRAPMVAVSEEV
jgi:hypothetical protein